MDRVVMFSAGHRGMKELLGSKGANLAEMTRLGLPIPPGFILTTAACREHHELGRLPNDIDAEVDVALAELERITGRRLGDPSAPLLLSVRSGAPVSMPGMMETVLNLGIDERSVEALARETGNPRFAWDSYRRFVQMFAEVVLDVPHEPFVQALGRARTRAGVKDDRHLDAEALRLLVAEELAIVERAGVTWPVGARAQLRAAISAVFRSWDLARAVTYRNAHGIPHDLGTAVNVQAMVFGNRGENSATGVLFTRNPATGERKVYGEFLVNAQGEDVVAGIRTPQPLDELAPLMPRVHAELMAVVERLERHYRDVQDVEFTIEEGKLYVLQTRTGKRTGAAAVKIAVDMVGENLISTDEALLRVDPEALNQILHPTFDLRARPIELAVGLPASPGAASGMAVFSADEAELEAREGKDVILVSEETTPEDIHGMIAARGILTARGGMTSHAAVVARGMGKPCVSGCEAIHIHSGAFEVGERRIKRGDWISLSGTTGSVYLGQVATRPAEIEPELHVLLGWADERRRLDVRANADNPEDAARARELGARGIGLCRTEHMFMGEERLPWVQRMILAESVDERSSALGRLLPFQRADFLGIFRAMSGLPVTIRLLDPPLHEFLPDREELRAEVTSAVLARAAGDLLARRTRLLARAEALAETNPMLGLRGVRLGILYPEVYEMQVRAIFEAAEAARAEGLDVRVEIMIPLVSMAAEMRFMAELVARVAQQMGITWPYRVGTMIETPRAAVTAGEIAQHAEFFSFGTNDLTQMSFGFSRDDAEGRFFTAYTARQIMPINPFISLDPVGVGRLLTLAAREGREARAGLKVGVCGEHGGDPASIAVVDGIVDYVSCSPFRVPIARLAAAQSALRSRAGA